MKKCVVQCVFLNIRLKTNVHFFFRLLEMFSLNFDSDCDGEQNRPFNTKNNELSKESIAKRCIGKKTRLC